MFEDMMNYVHIDEKWFYMTKQKENYYLLPTEESPARFTKSKRFITKTMFMAAVARPRYDYTRKTALDGKIGIWPFVVQEPARRNSKNRPKGRMETKAITKVTRDVVSDTLIEKVIPAIKAKCPNGRNNTVVKIQ